MEGKEGNEMGRRWEEGERDGVGGDGKNGREGKRRMGRRDGGERDMGRERKREGIWEGWEAMGWEGDGMGWERKFRGNKLTGKEMKGRAGKRRDGKRVFYQAKSLFVSLFGVEGAPTAGSTYAQSDKEGNVRSFGEFVSEWLTSTR